MLVARQLRARVLARDLRVVPLLDLAEEDVGDGLAVELEALVDAVDVVGDRDRAEDRRDVDGVAALLLGGRELVVLHRRVGGAEVDGARAELRDAAAGADGLVVDGRALVLLEAGGPLLVDGRGNVAPAPLIVPPALAVPPPSSSWLEPPELGLLSSLPQAAAPSASTTQQLRASRFFDLTGTPRSRVRLADGRQARGRRGDSLLPAAVPDVKSA